MKCFAALLAAALLSSCAHAQDAGDFDSLFGPVLKTIATPQFVPLSFRPFQQGSFGGGSTSLPAAPRMTIRIIPVQRSSDADGASLGDMLRSMQEGSAGARAGCMPCATRGAPTMSSSPLMAGGSGSGGLFDSLLDNIFSQQARGSALRAQPAPSPFPRSPFPSLLSSLFDGLEAGSSGASYSKTVVDDGKTTKTTTVTRDANGQETHTTETRDSDSNGLGSSMTMRSFGSDDSKTEMSDLLDELFGIPSQKAQVQKAQEQAKPAARKAVQQEDEVLVDRTQEPDSDEDDLDFDDEPMKESATMTDDEGDDNEDMDDEALTEGLDDDEELDAPSQEESGEEAKTASDDKAAETEDEEASNAQTDSEDLKKDARRTQDSVLKAEQSMLDKATKGGDKTKEKEEELELEQEVDDVAEQSAELRKKMADQQRRLDALKERDAMESASAAIEAKRLRDAAKSQDKVATDMSQATDRLSELEQRLHNSVIA